MAEPLFQPNIPIGDTPDPDSEDRVFPEALGEIDTPAEPTSRLAIAAGQSWEVIHRLLNRPVTPWLGLVLTVCLLTPCLYAPLSCDDYVLRWIALGHPGVSALPDYAPYDLFRFAPGEVQENLIAQDHGLMPWYANPEVRIGFARGLASLTHYLEFRQWGTWGLPMYAHNIVWYAAACSILILCYRRIMPVAWVGTLAALLYMFDESHAMPVGWISNRNGLMALFFVALVIYFHQRWRSEDQLKFGLMAMAAFAVGMLCGEATVAACAYVFAYAVCLDKRGIVRGIAAIVPYGVILVAWAIPYKMMEYGTFGSGFYQDPVNETGEYLSVMMGRLPILVNSLFARPLARFIFWRSQLEIAVVFCLVIGLLSVTAYMLWPLLRKSAQARYFAVGMGLSLIPACATMAHDRNLLYASIGAMGLIALFFHGMATKAAWLPKSPVWNRLAMLMTVFWIFIHVMVAPYAMPAESLHMGDIGALQQETIHGLVDDPDLVDRDWVTINLPSDLDGWYLNGILHAAGFTPPRHMWHLTTGPFEGDVTRTGPNSFTIQPEGGYLISPWGRFFTSFDHRMVPGYTVELSGMTVEVLRVMPDGRPKEVEYTFDRPLEDPSLQFMCFHGFQFKPFDMPAIGETAELPARFMTAPKYVWDDYKRKRDETIYNAPVYSIKGSETSVEETE